MMRSRPIPGLKFCLRLAAVFTFVLAMHASLPAQENYFVTYSHQLEEPGNLEISAKSITGAPKGGNPFIATALEFEYGINGWWTAELYLDGQTTFHESTVFTGFRIENRIRPFMREHWINPVLYFEFEDLNSADKALLEVVGHDTKEDLVGRNSRAEREREAELKLILSSNFKGWNVSENFIAEKNLGPSSWEFGYAVGTSRPLALKVSPARVISVVKILLLAQKCMEVWESVTASDYRKRLTISARSSPGTSLQARRFACRLISV